MRALPVLLLALIIFVAACGGPAVEPGDSAGDDEPLPSAPAATSDDTDDGDDDGNGDGGGGAPIGDVNALAERLEPPNATEQDRFTAPGAVTVDFISSDSIDSLTDFYEREIPAAGLNVLTTETQAGITGWVIGEADGSGVQGAVVIGPNPDGAGTSVSITIGITGGGGTGGGSDDDDDDDTGDAPTFTDGPWTGGSGQFTVSGAVEHSVDAPITIGIADTQRDGALTRLAYNPPDGFVTIFISSTGTPFLASLTARDFSVTGGDCDVTYDRADDSEIDATFSCAVDEFYWYAAGDDPTGEITIEGSFTATR